MRITQDNFKEATPQMVAKAQVDGALEVPLTAFNLTTLLAIGAEIVKMFSTRNGLRKRVDAIEHRLQVQEAIIAQLVAGQTNGVLSEPASSSGTP